MIKVIVMVIVTASNIVEKIIMQHRSFAYFEIFIMIGKIPIMQDKYIH